MNFADIKIGMIVCAARTDTRECELGEVIELDPDVELARIAWDDLPLEDAAWLPAHALCPEVKP